MGQGGSILNFRTYQSTASWIIFISPETCTEAKPLSSSSWPWIFTCWIEDRLVSSLPWASMFVSAYLLPYDIPCLPTYTLVPGDTVLTDYQMPHWSSIACHQLYLLGALFSSAPESCSPRLPHAFTNLCFPSSSVQICCVEPEEMLGLGRESQTPMTFCIPLSSFD